MRRRYVTLRYSEELGCECPDIGQAHTVFEPDRSPQRTGLLDAQGNELFAIDEMDQIGFIRSPATS